MAASARRRVQIDNLLPGGGAWIGAQTNVLLRRLRPCAEMFGLRPGVRESFAQADFGDQRLNGGNSLVVVGFLAVSARPIWLKRSRHTMRLNRITVGSSMALACPCGICSAAPG